MQPEFYRKKKRQRETASPVGSPKENSGAKPGVPRFLGHPDSAEKLNVASDRHERDADRIAEESLDPKKTGSNSAPEHGAVSPVVRPDASTQSQAITGTGEPLPDAERRHFESSMNADFSDVRVHHDDAAGRAADGLNARAFTENRDIAFGPGQYQPATSEGRRLMAHELAHVKQQATGEVRGLQRDPKPETQPETPPAAPVSDEESRTNEFFNRDGVEDIQGRAVARYFETSASIRAGASAIDQIKKRLMKVSERYKDAYDNYSTAVTAAGKEARSQQAYFDFFMGVALGISVGLLSEWIFVAEGASLALEYTVEVGAEITEGLVGGGLKASGWTEFVGQDLAPSRDLDPMVLDLEIYKLLERLHEKVLSLAQFTDTQFLINGAAEYAIGEIKAHVAGSGWDLSELDLLDLIDTLVAADEGAKPLDKKLPSFRSNLEAVQGAIETAPEQTTREMEQDIWILWMSQIKDSDSNILDYDEIENRLHAVGVLGPDSRLGVDFGSYTFWWEEEEALQAARLAAPAILSRKQQLTGGGE